MIPDKISPEIGWRFWACRGNWLRSANTTPWIPLKPLKAECKRQGAPRLSSYVWRAVPEKQAESKITAKPGRYIAAMLPSAPKAPLPPGYVYALFGDGKHEAPMEGCSCGIYALDSLGKLYVSYLQSRLFLPIAFGKVALWGKVIPGERGWRAEYAYPSELFLLRHSYHLVGMEKLVRDLASAWRVPVRVVSRVDEVILEGADA